MNNVKKMMGPLILAMLLVACAQSEVEKTEGNVSANPPTENGEPVRTEKYDEENNELNDNEMEISRTSQNADYTTVSFAKGKSKISDTQKEMLRTFLRENIKNGGIEQVKLIVWSDQMPVGATNLSAAQRQLAKKRAVCLKSIIKKEQGHIRNVQAWNMAAGTHSLAKTMLSRSTGEDEPGSVFGMSKLPPGFSEAELDIINDQAAPSMAIILLSTSPSS